LQTIGNIETVIEGFQRSGGMGSTGAHCAPVDDF
jgi:hypothetical protein